MTGVLLLGAYGNFGTKIAVGLCKKKIPVILAGRNVDKLKKLQQTLQHTYKANPNTAYVDINNHFEQTLSNLRPTVVINTCGPFQQSNYAVAKSCIKHQSHYIDLADGRQFVSNIKTLDADAKNSNVTVISGASTVPALSSAVVRQLSHRFQSIDSLRYGITPGQRTTRGLATTKAILSYVGKTIPHPGSNKSHYGWQDLYSQKYPEIGRRWMANCDIPDLELFPQYFQIPCIQFSAGIESNTLHLGLWLASWLVRLGLPINLEKHAKSLLSASRLFDRFGSNAGGMHMILSGSDNQGKALTIDWFIIAKNGDGPQIPATPAIILAEKLLSQQSFEPGALPCVNLITYDEYINELSEYAIQTHTRVMST